MSPVDLETPREPYGWRSVRKDRARKGRRHEMNHDVQSCGALGRRGGKVSRKPNHRHRDGNQGGERAGFRMYRANAGYPGGTQEEGRVLDTAVALSIVEKDFWVCGVRAQGSGRFERAMHTGRTRISASFSEEVTGLEPMRASCLNTSLVPF